MADSHDSGFPDTQPLNEHSTAPKGLSGMAWFWIAVIAVLVLGRLFDSSPKSEFSPYNPQRDRAVTQAVEQADIRSGFTLSAEEAERVRSDAFWREVHKERGR